MNNRMLMRLVAPLVLGLVGSAGCNQADPMVPGDTDASTSGSTGPTAPDTGTADDDATADDSGTDDDTTETDEPPGEVNFYPLADGATWTYRHTTSIMEVWDEIVDMQEVTWNGMTAFEAVDNGNNGESTASILIRDGTAILRVRKDVDLGGAPVQAADYDPGFMRFDHAWQEQEGEAIVWTYDRTEYDGMGLVVDQSPRNQIFTIESLSTEVTVPAGTFDCIQFTRERLETGELKRFWFADGVGKVKHETLGSGATEELVEYSIP